MGRSGVTLGSLRDHFGIVLASFWGRFGVVLTILRSCWTVFGAILARFGPFLRSFCGFFVVFRDVECNVKQHDAREGENMQIPAKIYQKYAKLCINKLLFAHKTLVLLKNSQTRRFNL